MRDLVIGLLALLVAVMALFAGVDDRPAMLRQPGTWHAFGGFQGENLTLDLSKNVWANVTNPGGDLWSGMEADGVILTDDKIVFENTADYTGSLAISISGLANTDFAIRIVDLTTGSVEGYVMSVSTIGVGNFVLLSMPVYIEAVAGHEYIMQVSNTANNNDITFRDAVFTLAYLHD